LRPDQDYEIRQAFFVDKNIYAVVLRVKSEVRPLTSDLRPPASE
jgi:hypothetical protein